MKTACNINQSLLNDSYVPIISRNRRVLTDLAINLFLILILMMIVTITNAQSKQHAAVLNN